ncbi:DUF6116 family protein [Marinihelvus fidelis]|nr:DUF6116 family protein [Marinihelvus fidelis]
MRFPILVIIAAVLFVADMLVPDILPFVDEILLALGTVMLSRFKRRDA